MQNKDTDYITKCSNNKIIIIDRHLLLSSSSSTSVCAHIGRTDLNHKLSSQVKMQKHTLAIRTYPHIYIHTHSHICFSHILESSWISLLYVTCCGIRYIIQVRCTAYRISHISYSNILYIIRYTPRTHTHTSNYSFLRIYIINTRVQFCLVRQGVARAQILTTSVQVQLGRLVFVQSPSVRNNRAMGYGLNEDKRGRRRRRQRIFACAPLKCVHICVFVCVCVLRMCTCSCHMCMDGVECESIYMFTRP